MICPNCKQQLPDGYMACPRCGTSFVQQQYPPLQYQSPPLQYQEPPRPVQQSIQQQPTKKSTKPLILGLVIGISAFLLIAFLVPILYSYRPQKIDYGDATAFEQALNDGVNCSGKIVRFKVREFATPLAGYNVHAGKHLNFISFKNPGVSTGDTFTVKVTKATNMGDNVWQIWYKKVKNGKETDETIKSE